MLSQADDTAVTGARVLVVDDDEWNRRLLSRMLSEAGYSVEMATSGEEALAVLRRHSTDLVLLDVVMPGLNGIEVCRRVKAEPALRLTPVVLVTGLDDRANRIAGIEAGADDFVQKPVDEIELCARARSLLRVKRYTDDLDSAEAVIVSLAQTIEARDRYTEGHCQRLARYAVALGEQLGLHPSALATLERGGYLHDLGKIAVPDAILLKPGPLTAGERALIQQHPVTGDMLCGNLSVLRTVRPIVRHHHERLDGSGYPDGLVGDAIPLLAQIMGVVDVFDALTTDRTYRRSMSVEQACAALIGEVRAGWRRPDLVEAFVTVVGGGACELVPPSPRPAAPRLGARTA